MTSGAGSPILESFLEEKQQGRVWEGLAQAGWGPVVREDPMSRAQQERGLRSGTLVSGVTLGEQACILCGPHGSGGTLTSGAGTRVGRVSVGRGDDEGALGRPRLEGGGTREVRQRLVGSPGARTKCPPLAGLQRGGKETRPPLP